MDLEYKNQNQDALEGMEIQGIQFVDQSLLQFVLDFWRVFLILIL